MRLSSLPRQLDLNGVLLVTLSAYLAHSSHMDGGPGQKTPLVGGGGAPGRAGAGAPNREAIDRVRGQVDSVKDVMRDNIDRAIQRGESIEDLGNKSQQLDADAHLFRCVC